MPNPENPGYMTNGLPVLPDTSEVVNGIRYSIPMWKPSLVRGGRVMVRRSREPGEKGKVLRSRAFGIGKAAQSFGGEAQCVHWNTTGACADHVTHSSSPERQTKCPADEESARLLGPDARRPPRRGPNHSCDGEAYEAFAHSSLVDSLC